MKIVNSNRKIFLIVLFTTLLILSGSVTQAQEQYSGIEMDEIGINITKITFSNDDLIEGDIVEINVTIENTGPWAVNNINVSIFVDSQEIANITGIKLKPHEVLTLSCNWTAIKWNHSIGAMISIKGVPLPQLAMERNIYIEPKPIGNIQAILLVLGLMLMIMFPVILVPSIINFLKSKHIKISSSSLIKIRSSGTKSP